MMHNDVGSTCLRVDEIEINFLVKSSLDEGGNAVLNAESSYKSIMTRNP